jgi:toxin YoeB
MKIVFTELSWDDYLYWQKIDKHKIKRINELIKDIALIDLTAYQG